MAYKKHPPVPEDWWKNAFCKYKSPNLWDLDQAPDIYKLGRKHCIRDCVVREACLRKALQAGDTFGVVRGGFFFDKDQASKRKSTCVLCGHPVAPLTVNSAGEKLKALCWVCRRYTSCLAECGRMVPRKPHIGSYYCKHCAKK